MREKDEKKLFIEALNHFASTEGEDTPNGYGRIGFRPHFGTTLLMRAFANFLSDSPSKPSSGLIWAHDFPALLDEAFTEFRTLDRWNKLRVEYRKETGYEIPSLVNIHEGDLHRVMVVSEVIRLIPILAYPTVYGEQYVENGMSWLAIKLSSYFNAQWNVIGQCWDQFVRKCYREVMPRIRKESHRGNHGKFGKTVLMSYAIAGRVMFTFERNKSEYSISFVADDSDMQGHRAGPNTTATPYKICVEMIEDVVEHWDVDKFKEHKSVKLAGMP